MLPAGHNVKHDNIVIINIVIIVFVLLGLFVLEVRGIYEVLIFPKLYIVYCATRHSKLYGWAFLLRGNESHSKPTCGSNDSVNEVEMLLSSPVVIICKDIAWFVVVVVFSFFYFNSQSGFRNAEWTQLQRAKTLDSLECISADVFPLHS